MNIANRLGRLEAKAGFNDPLAELSDEQLEAAIASLTATIERQAGKPWAEYRREVEAAGTLAPMCLAEQRALVDSIKAAAT